jgi:hypothetical protein
MNEIVVNLAEQINRTYEESVALATQAKDQATTAITKALECGNLLLQQKAALQHGGWLEWLDANCPQIDERTARRYMGLAKRTHVSDLNEAATLRQAYLACGIIHEKPKTPNEPGPETPWVKFVKPLDAFRLWFNTRNEESPMEEWGEDALRVLSNELQWFVNLHAQIQQTRERIAGK